MPTGLPSSMSPLTTSLTVPSPPTATTVSAPPRERLPGQVDGVSGVSGDEHRGIGACLGEGGEQTGEFPSHPALAGPGIDDQDGAVPCPEATPASDPFRSGPGRRNIR